MQTERLEALGQSMEKQAVLTRARMEHIEKTPRRGAKGSRGGQDRYEGDRCCHRGEAGGRRERRSRPEVTQHGECMQKEIKQGKAPAEGGWIQDRMALGSWPEHVAPEARVVKARI